MTHFKKSISVSRGLNYVSIASTLKYKRLCCNKYRALYEVKRSPFQIGKFSVGIQSHVMLSLGKESQYFQLRTANVERVETKQFNFKTGAKVSHPPAYEM